MLNRVKSGQMEHGQSLGLPAGLPELTAVLPEQPEAARSSQEQPGATRSTQEQPEAARGSQEQPGAARSCQIMLNHVRSPDHAKSC